MSVLIQRTEHDVEIIVGDDCSEDSSYSIAKRFENMYGYEGLSISAYRNEKRIGEAMNADKLMSMATGDYVAYLDAADYWTNPDKLQIQAEFLKEMPDYSMCVTGYIELTDAGFSHREGEGFYVPSIPLTSERMAKSNIVSSSSSRMFRNYGSLRKQYFEIFPLSDWPVNFELSFKGKIGFLNAATYVCRVRKESQAINLSVPAETRERQISILSALLEYRTKNQESR